MSFSLLKNNYSNENQLIYIGIKHELLWSVRKDKELLNEINKTDIIFTSEPQNTMQEILFIERYMKNQGYNSVIIVTEPPHSRRVDILIRSYSKYLNTEYSYSIVGSKLHWWNKYSLLDGTYSTQKMDTFNIEFKKYFYKNYGV